MNGKNSKCINHQIRVRKGLLIGLDGNNFGEVGFDEAMKMAEESELDLVLVQEDPPIFKIMNYSKVAYEEHKKREKRNKRTKHNEILKEIRFSSVINIHDLEVKTNKIKSLLASDYKVKASVFIKPMKKTLQELARKVIKDVCIKVAGNPDYPVYIVGSTIYTFFLPHEKNIR